MLPTCPFFHLLGRIRFTSFLILSNSGVYHSHRPLPTEARGSASTTSLNSPHNCPSFIVLRLSSCLPTSSQSAFFQAGLFRTKSSGVSALNLISWVTCSQPAISMYLCLRYGAWWRQRSIIEVSRNVGCVVGTIFSECDMYQSLSHFPGEL